MIYWPESFFVLRGVVGDVPADFPLRTEADRTGLEDPPFFNFLRADDGEATGELLVPRSRGSRFLNEVWFSKFTLAFWRRASKLAGRVITLLSEKSSSSMLGNFAMPSGIEVITLSETSTLVSIFILTMSFGNVAISLWAALMMCRRYK